MKYRGNHVSRVGAVLAPCVCACACVFQGRWQQGSDSSEWNPDWIQSLPDIRVEGGDCLKYLLTEALRDAAVASDAAKGNFCAFHNSQLVLDWISSAQLDETEPSYDVLQKKHLCPQYSI